MKIKNPTNKDIYVVFEGARYDISAGGTRDIPEKVARFWVDIHNFLQIEESTAKQTKRTPKEIVEEIIQEVEQVDEVEQADEEINSDKE